MTPTKEQLLITGRTPILIDFSKGSYNKPKVEGQPFLVSPHVRIEKDRANAWASRCRLDEAYHLPCFDVDRRPDEIVVSAYGHGMYKVSIKTEIAELFAEAEPSWVPSTTDGHFHVYVEHPLLWEDYCDRLHLLKRSKVIQDGYYEASKARQATFVRMPHVKKNPADYAVDDGDPF